MILRRMTQLFKAQHTNLINLGVARIFSLADKVEFHLSVTLLSGEKQVTTRQGDHRRSHFEKSNVQQDI